MQNNNKKKETYVPYLYIYNIIDTIEITKL